MEPISSSKPIIPSNVIFKLTALWAFSESGLGGWMHALGMPFTGFFLGGFAIIIIGLIAWFSDNSLKIILQSTLLVLLVKFTISPQSPPPAYLAVAFQGLMGALFFRFFTYKIACVALGIITMLESALQKLIITTIIFGNSLWYAIDTLFKGIVKDLHLSTTLSFSFWIIVVYTSIYAIWGFIIGCWMIKIPKQIENKAIAIYQHLPKSSSIQNIQKSKSKKNIFIFLAILISILSLYILTNNLHQAIFILLRIVAILAFLIFILRPIFKYFMQRTLYQSKHKKLINDIVHILPEINKTVALAFETAKNENKGFVKYRIFIINLIVLTLYPINNNE